MPVLGKVAGARSPAVRVLDGVQALMLAMRTVHTELVESDAYKAGRLTWCEQTDLDLPPTWGGGSLYDVPPRPDGDAPTGPA